MNVYFIKLITFIYQQLTSCPGTVDQKNPLQSGSSNIYGINRVSSRTQFRTEKHKDKNNAVSITLLFEQPLEGLFLPANDQTQTFLLDKKVAFLSQP